MLTGIKKARLVKGIQQKELAEQLNVSPVSVNRWEQGKTLPNAKRLKSMAKILDTTVEELLENTEGKEVS